MFVGAGFPVKGYKKAGEAAIFLFPRSFYDGLRALIFTNPFSRLVFNRKPDRHLILTHGRDR